jgi:stage V sporulation protein B
MNRQSFLRGAVTLVSAGMLIKIMGFVYQWMMIRLAGTEIIGLFNMISPLYSMALVVATAGIPTAAARLIPGRSDQGKALIQTAATILIITSSFLSVLLLLSGPALLRWLHKDARVIPAFVFMTPNLLLISVSSVIRAYFQGHFDMRQTAAAQTLEQIIRISSGLLLVWLLAPYGVVWTLLGMSSAVTLSELGGFLYLMRRFTRRAKAPAPALVARLSLPTLKQLYSFGAPLTLTRIVLTLTGVFEASLIPSRLYLAGMNPSQAASFYGELTGVVMMLLNIPSIFTYSLSASLLPSVSRAQSGGNRGDLTSHIQKALSVSLLICVPIALTLFFYGEFAAAKLFGIQRASQMLKYLSAAGLFLWMSQVASGILQGLGRVVSNGVTALIGSGVRLAGIWYFGAKPDLMLPGICLSLGLGFAVTCLLNLLLIRLRAGVLFQPGLPPRALAAGVPSAFFLVLCREYLPPSVPGAALAAAGACALFYGGLYLLGEPWIRQTAAAIGRRRKPRP